MPDETTWTGFGSSPEIKAETPKPVAKAEPVRKKSDEKPVKKGRGGLFIMRDGKRFRHPNAERKPEVG